MNKTITSLQSLCTPGATAVDLICQVFQQFFFQFLKLGRTYKDDDTGYQGNPAPIQRFCNINDQVNIDQMNFINSAGNFNKLRSRHNDNGFIFHNKPAQRAIGCNMRELK